MGYNFLAIGRILINVATEELIIKVNGEQVVFNIFKAVKYPESIDDCFSVSIIYEVVAKAQEKLQSSNILEQALVSNNSAKNYEQLATMVDL